VHSNQPATTPILGPHEPSGSHKGAIRNPPITGSPLGVAVQQTPETVEPESVSPVDLPTWLSKTLGTVLNDPTLGTNGSRESNAVSCLCKRTTDDDPFQRCPRPSLPQLFVAPACQAA